MSIEIDLSKLEAIAAKYGVSSQIAYCIFEEVSVLYKPIEQPEEFDGMAVSGGLRDAEYKGE